MKIKRSIHFRQDKVDISPLTDLSMDQLKALREKSVGAEQAVFEKLCKAAGEWETHAAETMLFDRAIEYLKAPVAEHTSNRWQLGKYSNNQEISNMVYKMYYQIYEETRYNRETQKSLPVAWHLTWSVSINSPIRGYGAKIAGQDRKRFTDKSAMEKYLQGRIKAYSHLFTETAPPVPKGHEYCFSVYGQLLPGYRPEVPPEQRQEKLSILDKLAAAKQEVAKRDAVKPPSEKSKNKSHGEEL